MDKYLLKNYALFGKTPKQSKVGLDRLKAFIKNPILHFILFGAAIWIIADLAFAKYLPITLLTGLASTFSYAIAAVGFCLLMGYSGLASLGTGGFIGIGTYSVYYVMNESDLSFEVALVVAIAIAVVIGIIVGFISLRIEGIYLVILTLALSEILRNLYMVVKDTIKIPSNIEVFGFAVKRQQAIYVVDIFLILIMVLTYNIINSPTGRAMLAMKNSTAAAQAMGISLIKYRLLAFVLCTAYASLSGVMLMVSIRNAMASHGTSAYALITSLNILAAVIIGGYKSIWGAVLGAYIMYGMQSTLLMEIEFLQKNPVIITFVSGILVILVVMFYPGGFAQLLVEARTKIKALIKGAKEAKYGKDLG